MILEILRNPVAAFSYSALTALEQLAPGEFILESTDLDWQKYAQADLCKCTAIDDYSEQPLFSWSESGDKPHRTIANGYFDVAWEGRSLRLLQVQFQNDCGYTTHVWIHSKEESAVRDFFAAVSRWNAAIREEVYVYQEGCWQKDSELFQSIQSSRLENLILPPGLKEAIRDDASTFFDSRERYRRFNIAWKRGLILIGPPGNGKTHMIQGLINELKKPCLYLKSLKSRYQNEDRSIREVFDQARLSAPCILVMEDLDSLIDDQNRSFCLNELDGFRKNEGLLVIATTNHPDKLDPAIVDRPSRFDRKYHFELPAIAERSAYLRWWNLQLECDLRLSDPGIANVAAATEGFSFAYLKELGLASTMAWMNARESSMDETMAQQVIGLREQMSSVRDAVPLPRSKSEEI